MTWLSQTVTWYIVLFVIGIVFVPLTRMIFGRYFFDRGYPYAKTIGIIVLSFAALVTGMMRIIPFTWHSLVFLLFAFAVLNGWLFWRMKQKVTKFQLLQDKKTIAFIIFEELLFFVALVGYMMVRGQEPSIRGLEKFMDYGFMKSILRTEYFPPLDMWLSADPKEPAGYFINYYYFGHLTGSMLIKLSQAIPTVGYNLVLGTIFAQGVTLAFSFISNLIFNIKRHVLNEGPVSKIRLAFYGLLGSYLVNLGGNLHPIYAFTKGYDPENPVPFWQIFLSLPEMLDPTRPASYWYPNATRFIPKTIHEFPSYSYVVADLHGHVFDIPFVFVTLSLLFVLFLFGMEMKRKLASQPSTTHKHAKKAMPLGERIYKEIHSFSHEFIANLGFHVGPKALRIEFRYDVALVALLGFMTAVHYMTNALNGPIYLLFSLVIIFLISGLTPRFISYAILLCFSFFVFSYPFSSNFVPFASGIGVNCSPPFLTSLEKVGPLLFEKGNCQLSTWWMLFVLWGFFWLGLVMYVIALLNRNQMPKTPYSLRIRGQVVYIHTVDMFTLLLYGYGLFLTFVPEFIYAKDIYPDHFRANTMFKLGYQAFIMMNIALMVTLFRIRLVNAVWRYGLKVVFFIFAFFPIIYPYFAFPSYYPNTLKLETYFKPIDLDGVKWIEREYPQDLEVIQWFENNVEGQPIILEAQGDSYTDYNKISAYTGLPTVAGWWVHEWLWRGSPNVVGERIPDIEAIYQSQDAAYTLRLIEKYNVQYIIVSGMEKEKYKTLQESKFKNIATEVFKSKNGVARIYKVNR